MTYTIPPGFSFKTLTTTLVETVDPTRFSTLQVRPFGNRNPARAKTLDVLRAVPFDLYDAEAESMIILGDKDSIRDEVEPMIEFIHTYGVESTTETSVVPITGPNTNITVPVPAGANGDPFEMKFRTITGENTQTVDTDDWRKRETEITRSRHAVIKIASAPTLLETEQNTKMQVTIVADQNVDDPSTTNLRLTHLENSSIEDIPFLRVNDDGDWVFESEEILPDFVSGAFKVQISYVQKAEVEYCDPSLYPDVLVHTKSTTTTLDNILFAALDSDEVRAIAPTLMTLEIVE